MGAKPITLKCPKCHRGEYGYDRAERGVVQSGRTKKKWTWNTRRIGKTLSTMHESKCLDCGHLWWSTLSWVVDTTPFVHLMTDAGTVPCGVRSPDQFTFDAKSVTCGVCAARFTSPAAAARAAHPAPRRA
jgi:hypothetical protein